LLNVYVGNDAEMVRTASAVRAATRFATVGHHRIDRAVGNYHNLIRLGVPEVGLHELITPTCGSLDDRSPPFFRSVRYPVSELIGNLAEHTPAYGELIAIETEESNRPFRLLEGLDQTIQ